MSRAVFSAATKNRDRLVCLLCCSAWKFTSCSCRGSLCLAVRDCAVHRHFLRWQAGCGPARVKPVVLHSFRRSSRLPRWAVECSKNAVGQPLFRRAACCNMATHLADILRLLIAYIHGRCRTCCQRFVTRRNGAGSVFGRVRLFIRSR